MGDNERAAIEFQIAGLRREIEDRHAYNVKRGDERHAEMMLSLQSMAAMSRDHHGRISALEAIVGTLSSEWQKIRQRYHDMISEAQKRLALPVGGLTDEATVTWLGLRWFVAAIIASVVSTSGVIMGVLKLVGKL